MIDRNGAKKKEEAGFNSGFKDGTLLLAKSMSIRQRHHKHTDVNRRTHQTTSLQIKGREEPLAAKIPSLPMQKAVVQKDKLSAINRTKTPEGASELAERCYVSEHFRFSPGKQA